MHAALALVRCGGEVELSSLAAGEDSRRPWTGWGSSALRQHGLHLIEGILHDALEFCGAHEGWEAGVGIVWGGEDVMKSNCSG